MNEFHKRELAWIGDAVLALYVRTWLIEAKNLDMQQRADYFMRVTNNQFLTAFGEPTAVEAKIGKLFQEQNLSAAYQFIENSIIPVFIQQLKNKRLPLPDVPKSRTAQE